MFMAVYLLPEPKMTKKRADYALASFEREAAAGTLKPEQLAKMAIYIRENYREAGVRTGYVTSAANKRIKQALKTAITRDPAEEDILPSRPDLIDYASLPEGLSFIPLNLD